MYKEPINSPFVPNEQKTLTNQAPTTKYYDEAPKIPLTDAKPYATPQYQQPKPLVDLQVYQPPQPKSMVPKTINPAQYVPMNLPVAGPFIPPQYNPHWPTYSGYYPQLVSPIIKQFSINNGPFLETTTLKTGAIREDILPKQMSNTSNTLGERLNIHSFVRSVFIKTYDGEDIDIDGQGNNSILRYLKFLELNPYSPEINIENPYMGMPTDMLLYKSCYPIKFDDKTNSLQCSPNSLGMNVRIYTLSFAEYNVKKLNGHDFSDYDIWREMAYYEFVRENILKKKLCPNFVLMHCYYISENCNIDRNKVLMLKGKALNKYGPVITYLVKQSNMCNQNIMNMISQFTTSNPPFVTFATIKKIEKELFDLQNRYKELMNMKLAIAEQQQLNKAQMTFTSISDGLKQLLVLFKKNTIPPAPAPIIPPPTTSVLPATGLPVNMPQLATYGSQQHSSFESIYDFSGKGLVAMTESPTYNFYDWASVKYEAKGNIHTMINTGFHTSDVWMSVLFQIMVGLHVLQTSGIAFKDFSIGDNIYIKDIADHNNGKSYWKYVIDSYEYYIPNYGYLVLFDTNYKDIDISGSTLLTPTNADHKIYSNIFKPGVYTDINDRCFDAFVNTFDVNNFTKSFSNNGGSGIPDNIRKLFNDITTKIGDNTTKDIHEYISKFMRPLLNNRVGTNLLETEHKFINHADTTDFKKGQMIVHEIANDTFKFVIYVNDEPVVNGISGNKNILTRDPTSNEIIPSRVHRSALKHYSKFETITQTIKDGMTFSENDMLEVYRC
jgi:hypothetical protein